MNKSDVYEDKVNTATEINHIRRGVDTPFRLASERALDTMNLCGCRAKLSRGALDEVRTFRAANGDEITLHRACEDDKFVEVTQDDLDIMRAINTKYIEEVVKFRFIKESPTSILDGTSEVSNIESVKAKDLPRLINEGLGEIITVTPEEIRKRLGRSKDIMPTAEITQSLTRLSTLAVNGTYRVRAGDEVQRVAVNGTLFSLATFPGKNNSVEYSIIFATKWGHLYLHNLRSGNITWLTDPNYMALSDGAKSVLNTVLAFPNTKFFRNANCLLEILNIKAGKNKARALYTLEKYLTELQRMEYVVWNRDRDIYYIEYQIDPTNSRARKKTKGNDVSELNEVLDERSKTISDLAKHYNMLARNHLHALEYYALPPNNPQGHKNWPWFEKVYDLAITENWHPKVYIESQFALAKKWKDSEVDYPLPHMLVSEEGRKWFPKYVKERNEYRGYPANAKLSPRKTKTLEDEIIEGITSDVKSIDLYLRNKRMLNMDQRELQVEKILIIYTHWLSFSPYYLWSVKWFHEVLKDIKDNSDSFSSMWSRGAKAVIDYFEKIKERKDVQAIIEKYVAQLEQEKNIPSNADPVELTQEQGVILPF